MENQEKRVKERLNVKDMDLTKNLSNINRWDKLSTEEDNLDFIEEFKRVIDD